MGAPPPCSTAPVTWRGDDVIRSSPEDALAERRLRLSVMEDGLVTSIISGDPDRLFGLEPTQASTPVAQTVKEGRCG